MKKIFALAIAAVTISMASCGGKTASTADPDSLSVETAVEAATPAEAANQVINLLRDQIKKANPEQIKVIGQSVAQKVAEYVAAGDNEAVQTYTAVINNFIAENAERLQTIGASSTISEALASVSGLPSNIAEAATQAAEGVKTEALTSAINALASGENVLEAVKAVAGDAATTAISSALNSQEAKDAAAEVSPEAVKEAVKEAAKQQATDATNKAIDDAAAAAKKKLGL